jgi:hypothetical protein
MKSLDELYDAAGVSDGTPAFDRVQVIRGALHKAKVVTRGIVIQNPDGSLRPHNPRGDWDSTLVAAEACYKGICAHVERYSK